jgi:O-antigen ligase
MASALVVWSLFAAAGVYVWAGVPIVGGALLLAVTAAPRVPGSGDTRTVDLLLLILLAVVAASLVPLPEAIRTTLSPRRDALQAALSLTPADAPVRPLALDAAAGVWALTQTTAALLTFWACRHVFGRRGTTPVVQVVAIAGLLATVTALAQQAIDPARLYGVWMPLDPGARPFGPFVNRNHFATWAIMAIPLAMGCALALVAPERGREVLRTRLADAVRGIGGLGVWLLVSAAVLVIGVLASASRSGAVSVAAAVLAFAAIGRPRAGRRVRGWALAGFGLLVLAVAAYTSLAPLLARAEETLAVGAGDRPQIWRDTWAIVRDFWLTGVGAGGFASAMVVYQRTGRELFSNQAHNQYLQLLAEGGLLVGVPALLAIVAFGRLVAARLRSDGTTRVWIRVGATAGLIGVACQSMWETGLRMPANAILCAVVAAVAVHRPSVVRRSAAPGDAPHDRALEPGPLL